MIQFGKIFSRMLKKPAIGVLETREAYVVQAFRVFEGCFKTT